MRRPDSVPSAQHVVRSSARPVHLTTVRCGSRKGFVETRFRASHAGIDMRGGRTSVVAGPSQSAAPLLTRLTRADLARRTLLGAEAFEPPRVQGLAGYDYHGDIPGRGRGCRGCARRSSTTKDTRSSGRLPPLRARVVPPRQPRLGGSHFNPFLKRRSPGSGGSRGFCNSTAGGRTEFFAIGRVEQD